MKSQSGVDLSLVTFDEIWDELKSRYDLVVVITSKDLDGKNDASEICYSGGKLASIGACEHARDKILRSMDVEEGK